MFAPTNAAFAEYLSAFNITATQLLASPALRDVLLYHVVPQAYSVSALGGGGGGGPTSASMAAQIPVHRWLCADMWGVPA